MLTLHIAVGDLAKLDRLAEWQGRSLSQLVQEALLKLVNDDLASSDRDRERVKKRPGPAIKEQCAILDQAFFADEHRSFCVRVGGAIRRLRKL